jgi:hypothetical protein
MFGTFMSQLQLAYHPTSEEYWQGDVIALHMSGDRLDNEQWKQWVDALWQNDAIGGPLPDRYLPEQTIETGTPVYPERSSSLKQYGALQVDGVWVGVDILITRSLFECITLITPLAMFEATHMAQAQLCIEAVYKALAARLYQVVPFSVASLGLNRDCQILTELRLEDELQADFFRVGNALMTDEALAECNRNPANFEKVLPGLRWVSPQS